MVLEKTLESPLDFKEIKPVNPKGNQSWIFFRSWSWSSNTLATWCKATTLWERLISFRIDWFDILAVQGTRRSLLQPHSSKASILWHLAFFMVQLSHWYMTTENTMKWKWSRSVVSDSSRPHGLYSTRLLCPWNFPGKNAGVGCHFLKWCLYSLIRCIGLS